MQTRYHIQLNNKRTTISVDNILSELLAVKLNLHPKDIKTHSLLREWFEQTIRDRLGDDLPPNSRVSQWARTYAIEAVADQGFMKKVRSSRLEQR